MRVAVLAVLFAIVLSSTVLAQPTNSNPWPASPRVGIGTERAGGAKTALHLHLSSYDSDDPILRMSVADSTSTAFYGSLGYTSAATTSLSSLSTRKDLILHDHSGGDIILTNFWPKGGSPTETGGAIRAATAGDISVIPSTATTLYSKDYERLTILPFGNVGIDVAPDTTTGLGKPHDQLEIGGGSFGYGGSHLPGLTIYGGNRFEGVGLPGGTAPPIDWRYIAFNWCTDHITGVAHRIAPVGGSGIAFSETHGGLIRLHTSPKVDTGDDFEHGMMFLMDSSGLGIWSDLRMMGGSRYHHLIDIWKPDSTIAGDSTGMFFHHTPVYIGMDEDWGTHFHGFTSYSVQPAMGGSWMLAVDGPALFKEAYVNTPDWPDFVFKPGYNLRSLGDLEEFINANHHLPDVPSAADLKKSGVPLGATTATLMQKLEEQQLYIIALNKKIEALEAAVNGLKGAKQ